jgi:hypothetical protein
MYTLDSPPIRLFREMFGDRLVADDYMEFYSNRRKGATDTFLRLDIYKADRIATVIVESYGVRGKLTGDVITLFPEPAWDVPIFMFQLGGNAHESIALLDISPTLPDHDYGPLEPVFARYRPQIKADKPVVEWVRSISSPYLLDCQYAPLDRDLFMAAMRDYLRTWIDHYYVPARRLEDPARLETATQAILRYKQVLHEGDPAHGIFSKAWGRRVADAFMYLETRDHPALDLPA